MNAPTRSRALCLALSCLALAACPRPAGPGPSPLEVASRAVKAGSASPRDRALAGFAGYLSGESPEQAAALFQPGAKGADDVWAAYGRCELARRSLDTRARVLSALGLCQLGPRHPLCAVGARIAVSATGESLGLDAAIEAGALEGLKAGADGDAAFLLRLAAAVARRDRGDDEGARALLAESGAVSAAALLGPYSRYHVLEWEKAFPPESGEIGGGDRGPDGPIAPRPVVSYEGRYALFAEATSADVFYLATDVEVREAGPYLLRVVGRGTFRAFVDGAPALERRDFAAWAPDEAVAGLALAPGRHRLLVKLSRGGDRGDLALALARADGRPSRLSFAPARGRAEPRPPARAPPQRSWPDAASLEAALEPEAGPLLASFAAARDALERDDQGAKALALALAAQRPASAPALVLRGEAESFDRTLPSRIGKGRAKAAFEDALKLDPREASVLQRLSVQARSDGRFDEASELLDRAREAAFPGSWRTLLSEMRLAQARSVDALAEDAARRALALEPGLCDALDLRYDLARRLDAVAAADRLIQELQSCPGGVRRLADHRKLRGDLEGARELLARLERESPLDPQPAVGEAALLTSLGRPLEAAARLEALERAWPRNASFHKSRADALELGGDAAGARAEREAALALDGSDLRLRRALAFADGTDVLEDLREDGGKALADYEAARPAESAPGVYVLDAAAVEAYPDGSTTERTHVVAKVLDQRGVSMLAEVHLPAGAEIVTLRTLKKDGRVLEPEAIGGKDATSLPGVEVGDVVEYEYLLGTGARGAATPGFAAPKFYFRIVDGQLFRSLYEVRAPQGTGLEVDAHHLPPRPGGWVEQRGGRERVRVQASDVPTFVREPGGPQLEEVLPFVQVGTGAGLEETMAGFGDFLLEKSRPTAEIARFARQAAGSLEGGAAARAVYAKVMEEIKGPEGALTTRASATLAQGRGSRLMLLKAALAARGIRSRIALVRPFTADPSPYRFAPADLYGYAALAIALPEGEVLVSPGIRFAPFGRLSPQAEGMSAAILPEVSEPVRFLQTAGKGEADGKKVALTLALAADGTLAGSGEERYQGLEAAYLKAGLEKLNQEQRRQAIESAIARTFDNATLSDFAIEERDEPGAPVWVRYRFAAPGFARADGARLVASRGLYPANLARRFLALFERKTPLLIGNPEALELSADLELPEGMSLSGPPTAVTLASPFGRYERAEEKGPRRLRLHETLQLRMARVSPAEYPAFGEFVASVDKAQEREWVFEAPLAPPAAAPPLAPPPGASPGR